MLPGIRAELFMNEGALRPYFDGWDALAVAAGNPYVSPVWALSWWRYASGGARLRVLVGLEGNDVVGVMACASTGGGLRPCRWRLLGAETSAPVEPLGDATALAGAFSAAAAGAPDPPDVLWLEGIPAESPWPAALAGAWPGRRPAEHVDWELGAPGLSLQGLDYATWFAGKSANFRKQMKQSRRRLDKEGATFRRSTLDDLDADLRSFARLHYGRWTERGGSEALDAGVEAMLADVGRRLIPLERYSLWSLDVGGTTISSQLYVEAGETCAWWLGGFDDDYAKLKPALQANLVALHHAFDRGLGRLDLGPGEQDFKFRFADGERPLQWRWLAPRTARYPLARAPLALRQLRRAAGRRLSPERKAALREAADRGRARLKR